MNNEKDDEYQVGKMLDIIEFIQANSINITAADLRSNVLLSDSLSFRLVQLAEHADKLSDSFKATNNKIPWHKIRGLRNRLVHDYGNADMDTIVDIIKNDLPELKQILKPMQG